MSPAEAAAMRVAREKLHDLVAAATAGSQPREELHDFVAAVRAGGLKRDRTLELLMEVPEIRGHFAGLQTAIRDEAEDLIAARDEAPQKATQKVETLAQASSAAQKASEKATIDQRAKKTAAEHAQHALHAEGVKLRNLMGGINLVLEELADPALRAAIDDLEAEWQAMHARIPGLSAGRFAYSAKPDGKARKRQHEQAIALTREYAALAESLETPIAVLDDAALTERIEAEIGIPPEERYPYLGLGGRELLSPRGEYGQTCSYMEMLAWAVSLLRVMSCAALTADQARAAIERVKAAIPYRDGTMQLPTKPVRPMARGRTEASFWNPPEW